MSGKLASRKQDEAQVMEYLRRRAEDERRAFAEGQNRRSTVSAAREKVFLDGLADVLRRNAAPIVPPKYKLRSKKPTKRILNLALSDLHYGSDLDPREIPSAFGVVEEARRTAQVAVEVAEYKARYREETSLFVYLIGDIIHGELHDPRAGAPLAEQFFRALTILTRTFLFLSAHFPQVVVYCSPGNHGRRKARHPDRATTQKWDSYENMIYYALKTRLEVVKNIEFRIPYKPYVIAKAFKHRVMATHGDTVIEPGFPSQRIDVQKVRNQINEWNAAEGESNTERCEVFLTGHVHTGATIEIPSGPTLITNGCIIPSDPYAISRGIRNTKCGQQLFETVEDHPVGDHRFIKVTGAEKDPSLDKIIPPFEGMDA